MPAAKRSGSKKRTTPVKAVEAEPEPIEIVEEAAPASTADDESSKPSQRTFEELFAEMSEMISAAYKHLQQVNRQFRQLNSAYKRSLQKTSTKKKYSASKRTPTVLIKQSLLNYLNARLDAAEMTVTRKTNGQEESIDLSGLTTETRVFRTDVTMLLNVIFRKHNLLNPENRRNIIYNSDKDLVKLLTTGVSADHKADVADLKKGKFELNIFNIQRFISQHLDKWNASQAKASTAKAN